MVWKRGEEPEFGRVAFFTDAVFAIALTLLVLDLRLPALKGSEADTGVMLTALGELIPKFVSFGVAFILLARYWLANHSFFTRIGRVDRAYLAIDMCYLAAVAFLPFPTSLVGEYEENALSGVFFALALAAVSGLETVLLAHAHRAGLMRHPMEQHVYRWEIIGSLVPFVMFTVTIPLAFISPTVMLISWAVVGPILGRTLSAIRPAGSDGY